LRVLPESFLLEIAQHAAAELRDYSDTDTLAAIHQRFEEAAEQPRRERWSWRFFSRILSIPGRPHRRRLVVVLMISAGWLLSPNRRCSKAVCSGVRRYGSGKQESAYVHAIDKLAADASFNWQPATPLMANYHEKFWFG